MTATVQPPVAAEAETGPAPGALTRADGLELLGDLQGSGYEDDVALVRRADGQMVQLGPLMYALLASIDGRRDRAELAAAMSERLGRGVEAEHVDRLAEKLAEQGLLAGSEQHAPAPVNPLLGLRWKYLITDTDVTRRLTRPFTGLFRPWLVLPVLAAFLAVVWFVVIHKGVASATAQAFQSPELLLLVFAIAVASAGFHELGHAAACRYGGATPGGMGVGLYVVWPAFYTDVTDAYRLPRGDRLRVDLGGLYFNTIVAVATLGAWALLRVDALLLIVALQLVQMVQQLSPVIRADGYHILSDLTGVPDLYQHMGPTLRRLIPGKRAEPSALTGRARALVTAWVLIVVPLLLALSVSLILLFPRLIATAWESGQNIASGIPDGNVAEGVLSVLRLIALTLPVLGVAVLAQRLIRTTVAKARAWSRGRPGRRLVIAIAAAALAAILMWAWWPSGQYRPIRASEGGTLGQAASLLSAPATGERPGEASAVELKPGKHLAVALVPEGGASEERPAAFVIKGDDGQKPVVILSPDGPETTGAPAAAAAGGDPPPDEAPSAAPASASSAAEPVPAAAFPFALPAKPGPNGTQALAVNTKDGSIRYTVAYTVVTVHDGSPVDHTNEAYAFASCNACTTVAVSFQVVLIVGQTDLIAPINVAGALNADCLECLTTAIANQIVVTLDAVPSDELIARLNDALDDLEGLDELVPNGSPALVAAEVEEIEQQIHDELEQSGLLTEGDDPAPGDSGSGTSTTPAPSDTSTTDSPQEPAPAPEQSGTTTTTEDSSTTTTETTTTPTETSTTEQPAPSDTTTSPSP